MPRHHNREPLAFTKTLPSEYGSTDQNLHKASNGDMSDYDEGRYTLDDQNSESNGLLEVSAEFTGRQLDQDQPYSPAVKATTNPLYTRIHSWMSGKYHDGILHPNDHDQYEKDGSSIIDEYKMGWSPVYRRFVWYCVAAVLFIVLLSSGIATGVSYGILHAEHSKNGPSRDPWSAWSAWSACSVSCGAGMRTRNRICFGDYCGDKYDEMVVCSMAVCIDPWSDWSAWSPCSATCGAGMMTRNRTCSREYCGDKDEDMEVCSMAVCIDAWSVWGNWGECSVSCGTGERIRSRTCTGQYCGDNDVDKDLCYNPLCEGQWSSWGDWGPCSITCGCGLKTRGRTCTGEYCTGDQYGSIACKVQDCGGPVINNSVRKPSSSLHLILLLGTLLIIEKNFIH